MLAAVSETVKIALVEPVLPSDTIKSLIDSAGGTTRDETIVVLFAVFGSLVSGELMSALFVTKLPTAAPGGTLRTKVKLAEAPGANVAIVASIMPKVPTVGVVKENVGPAVCVIETKVEPGGGKSRRVTFAELLGPLLVATML